MDQSQWKTIKLKSLLLDFIFCWWVRRPELDCVSSQSINKVKRQRIKGTHQMRGDAAGFQFNHVLLLKLRNLSLFYRDNTYSKQQKGPTNCSLTALVLCSNHHEEYMSFRIWRVYSEKRRDREFDWAVRLNVNKLDHEKIDYQQLGCVKRANRSYMCFQDNQRKIVYSSTLPFLIL